ncbi:MAG TPA: hypothetical protein VF782_14330 [Allosphingosinicella sp.]
MADSPQDRIGKGPFGALLILLGLLLSSGTAAAAGLDLRQSAPRLGSSRSAAAVALLPSGVRNPAEDDAPQAGGGAAPPSGPGVVTRHLWERPAAGLGSRNEAPRPEPSDRSYRARAPPAA